MTKKTFQILQDHDGREYIYQVVKECDKNHKEDDMEESNESRIYANPGKKCPKTSRYSEANR